MSWCNYIPGSLLREDKDLSLWEEEKKKNSDRKKLLMTAEDAVLNGRNNTYGPPTQDFARVAKMLTAMGFFHVPDEEDGTVQDIAAHHVAMIMIALKLSRLVWSPDYMDSWVDVAGYAACGWECVSDDD